MTPENTQELQVQKEWTACVGARSENLHPHFMLVPSLACPAECSYCFGPHDGPTMSAKTMEDALDFMVRIAGETNQREVKVTFHGGEPLMAGCAIWSQALEGLAKRFGQHRLVVALQSNLWLVDHEFCQLFCRHKVEVGTSLDGPEDLTDQQRGKGYFAHTMAGIRKTQDHGLSVGCIATFTPHSLLRWREVFDFFVEQRIDFSIHAAVPPLDDRVAPFTLTPSQYGSLLRQMLDCYIEHRRDLTVSSLDQMVRGLVAGDGKVCIFRDCLGIFIAIDPAGNLYPCQRFCGRPEYRFGTLAAEPKLEDLFSSPVARRFDARQKTVRQSCDGCSHFAHCRGGCPYNAWAGGYTNRIKDPYCEAYREVFDHIRQRLSVEMASEENLNAIAEHPYTGTGHPILRKGPLIELVRDDPHPNHIAKAAKRIVAAVELAKRHKFPTVAIKSLDGHTSATIQEAL